MLSLGILILAVAFSIYVNHEDAFAHHVLKKIPVIGTPMSMALTDDSLYVSSFEYPRVSIFDIKNDKDAGFITTSSSGIMDVAPVPDKNKIYVAPFESGGIDVYTLSTKLLIKTIPLPDSEINIQTTSNQPYGHRSDMHFLTGGWSLDYNPAKELLYVADYNSHLIYVIDGKTDEIIQTIPVPRHPFTVKVDPISNTVIVASLAGNEITFLEDVTDDEFSVMPIHEVTKTITVSGAPWGLDVDPRKHLAYVTNRGCECITVIDILNQEIAGTIPLGDKAHAIAIDTDEHQIYASYLTQNKIVKIDASTNEIVSGWNVDSKTWDIAVDSNTHKFYASLKSTDEVLVFGPRSISISLPAVTLETPATFLDLVDFHGQDVMPFDLFVNTRTDTLTASLQAKDGGKLAVHIPRNILDARQSDGTDARFEVRVDGITVNHEESKIDENMRMISIQVPQNAHSLAILGTASAQEKGEYLQSKIPTTEPELMTKAIICEDKVWIESLAGKIACVTPSTAQKLVERGWGTMLE